jgi:hypothetical protein
MQPFFEKIENFLDLFLMLAITRVMEGIFLHFALLLP